MDPALTLSWAHGVTVDGSVNGLVVNTEHSRITLSHLSQGVHEALLRLSGPVFAGATALVNLVTEVDGPAAISRWFYFLRILAKHFAIHVSVRENETCYAFLESTELEFAFAPAVLAANKRYVFSSYAWLRRQGNSCIVESSLSSSKITIVEPHTFDLLHALMQPTTAIEASALVHSLPVSILPQLLYLFIGAGMACEAHSCQTNLCERPNEENWEFHDLLFHTRSRSCDGRRGLYKNEWHHGNSFEAGHKNPSAAIILYKPNLQEIKSCDPPFANVVESRQSVRKYGATPLDSRQLGEFLFRTCRDRAADKTPTESHRSSRPYPAGGGIFELEIYVVVKTCLGLDPGCYHYIPQNHALSHCYERTNASQHLIADAARSAGIESSTLQVLLILASRVSEVSSRYHHFAYSLVLKNAGAVLQTMYLTAAVMNLAPCAIGAGDSDLFAEAFGVDYFKESSVGEFLLGSRG